MCSTGHIMGSINFSSVHFSSVAQLCLTLYDPRVCSIPGLLPITNSRSLLKLMSVESMMPSNHLILCRPLLLLPSIFPNIRVRWVYLSFSPSSHFSSLLFSTICKAPSDNHFAFLPFLFFRMVLITASCTVLQTSVHSSSVTLYQI